MLVCTIGWPQLAPCSPTLLTTSRWEHFYEKKNNLMQYIKVNLVKDSRHNVYQYGLTKSHWMSHIMAQDLSTSSSPKAVIIIVLIVIILLAALLVLLYYKRRELTDYLTERRKAKAGVEFAEYPTKLTANPDFMASLAPQWPEPEPDPTEDQAFLHQQVLATFLSKFRLGLINVSLFYNLAPNWDGER